MRVNLGLPLLTPQGGASVRPREPNVVDARPQVERAGAVGSAETDRAPRRVSEMQLLARAHSLQERAAARDTDPPPAVRAFREVAGLGDAEFMGVGGRLDLFA